jgi:ectoine hydroxylase-related dioxygenase (phytanoyl-CoA dioxygenase family)
MGMSTVEAPAGPLSANEMRQYDANGYHITRGLISTAEADDIRAAFMAFAAQGPVPGISDTTWRTVVGQQKQSVGYGSSDPLARYPRMMHPHKHLDQPVGPLALKYLLDPRIGAVLGQLLADEPVAAQTMYYFKPPGARGQDFHQDNFYLRVKPGSCLAAWVAIDPSDEDNGGMMVVPGSHRTEIVCPEQADSTRFFSSEHVPIPAGLAPVTCQLQPGDVLFFNGSIIHGSYPNRSATRFRQAFISHYVPAGCAEVANWYRPLLRFDGTEVAKEVATGGGPCGEQQVAPKGPH